VNATARRSITRQVTAILGRVMQLPTDLLFRLLDGTQVQQMLDLGQLVTVNTILDGYGVEPEFKDGYHSWAGRHIATAYRLTNHRNPLKAWVRHRTTGRWIHAHVYVPGDPAIESGLRSYSRTAHLVPVHVLAEVA
jgi:hypothetical protein